MKKDQITSEVSSNDTAYKVHGTVRNAYQQLMPNVTVSAYNKTMQSKILLGTAITAADGSYTIIYTLRNPKTTVLIVGVYNDKGKALKENDAVYEIPVDLEVDFDLSGRPLDGPSDYDRQMELVTPFTEDVPLEQMKETADDANLTLISKKTGLNQTIVEQIAMAARFEKLSDIPAYIWYGILSLSNTRQIAAVNFDDKVNQTFDFLMHNSVNSLTSTLEAAISANVIAYHYLAEVPAIKKKLSSLIVEYAKQHPITGQPSALLQKVQIGGLTGTELHAFIEAKVNHSGDEAEFWQKLENGTVLSSKKKVDAVRAAIQVATFTGNNLPLTENLVKEHKITDVSDIKKLAGYTKHDWADMLKKSKIVPDSAIPGKSTTEKIANYAAQLDASFTSAFPTAAFAARLQKDKKTKLPHADKVSKFLQQNEGFDLLNHHIGTFIKQNPKAVAKKDEEHVTEHVRRIQRVMKLTPSYESATTLLNDGIHSAQQIQKMGQDNFVNAYSDTLGEAHATQVFQQASATHASALALTANLKSMADASAMNAFPNFGAAIATGLSNDLPNLDTLFQHTDFCECDECSSVYGASAYLTDILHYLAQRNSTLPPPVTGASKPSVKNILLRRRPDLGDIDLNCDNTNTLVPYIDIACELMEDYISPPVITLANSIVVSLAAGTITSALLTALKTQFTAAGQGNISGLLTAAATVSQKYTATKLQDNNTFISNDSYIIRDAQIALKATVAAGAAPTVEVRVLHQTFQDSDTINAGPEYVNTNVYSNFLATAKAPFSLPFDLFETEGELYLQQLGISKADLIDIFRKEDHTAPGNSVSDIKMGYAKLGINVAEQALIFTADPTHQSLYWGGAGADITTEAEIDVFQSLTNLTYDQILSLISLPFINPNKDILIQHYNLIPDVTTQRLIKLDNTKLDAMHRFLRLWRKTSFSMEELDAIIMASKMGNGAIPTKLAYLISKLADLQQKLRLSVFEILAFYQNIDTTHNQPNCLYNQLFQNGSITNPVSVNFSIAVATVGTTGIVEADKPVLAAILQIPVSDVNLLLAKTNSKISLANFSLLFRYTKLALGLGLSITDLLALINLVDANPFLDPVSTTLFVNKYNLLKTSGFSIDELNYILRHQDNTTHTLVPSAGQVTAALTQVQAEFLAINAANQPTADPNGQLLTKWLSDGVFNWDRAAVNRLVDILNTVDDTVYLQKLTDNLDFLNNLRLVYHDAMITADLPALPLDSAGKQIVIPAAIAPQLSYNANTKQLQFIGYMNAADKTALLALVTGSTTDPNVALFTATLNYIFTKAQQTDSSTANVFFSGTNTIDSVLIPKVGGNTAARFSYFVNIVSPVYIKIQQQNALIKDIVNWFTIDKKVATQLLVSVPGIFTDFSAANFIGKAVPLTNAVQVNRYLLLAKMGFIIAKLKLTVEELAFQVARAVDIASLDITTLPVAPATAAATTFPAFEAFINLLRFDQNYPPVVTNVATGATISIYSILTDAVTQKNANIAGTALTTWTATLVANLSLLTGWNQADLGTLIGAGGNIATLTLPQDIYSVPILTRLNSRITMQQQLGISINDAFGWTKDALLVADTAKIKQVVKSKYVNADWVQVSKKAQDTLREKKRDALIAYLLANPGTQTWKNADDLYAFFLMDVEMCSCQPTSRIVQASNSVQLFVQRSFMQLEANVLVDTTVDSAWNQWQWMKNFRVWQANKKVFLWPENYIEPELLPVDYKSSFFSELEEELLQGEVNATNVEDAFMSYLDKLREVSRLEIKTHFYDDFTDTFHVIGRTYGGEPRTYYYRKLTNGRRWTPWKKIDLGIQGEMVLPVVYNNRVYLFWATVDPVKSGQFDMWRTRLAYSEYKNGKWSPKKITDDNSIDSIEVLQANFIDPKRFFLVAADIPNADYAGLVASGQNTTGGVRIPELGVLKNGALLVNFYYWKPKTGAFEQLTDNVYLGSFQLDHVKGFPVKSWVPANIDLFGTGSLGTQNIPTKNISNMFQVELTPPTGTGTVTVGPATVLIPDQGRGGFKKTFSVQMSTSDRIGYALSFRTYDSRYTGTIETGLMLPKFYQDNHRTYLMKPVMFPDSNHTNLPVYEYINFKLADLAKNLIPGVAPYDYITQQSNLLNGNYRFSEQYFSFYHPLIGYFTDRLFEDGIDGLMDRNTQLKGDAGYDATNKFNFSAYYNDLLNGTRNPTTSNPLRDFPIYTGVNNAALPVDDVDFSLETGYGLYNWELFYHAPLMIAERLSQNQQFDDADKWYKYIFNPFDTSDKPSPNKFWITKPFFETTSSEYLAQRIDKILESGSMAQSTPINDLTEWRYDPFQPHFIAQHRTVAYQKVAVMKYIDHLIRYGDYLFAQDTMESVNQATQLYILASEILGPKPQTIPSPVVQPVDNYNQLEGRLDTLSDAMVAVENLLPYQSVTNFTPHSQGLPTLFTQYFCLPMNENLIGPTGQWDVIADRLFKIRHCLNIDGTVAPLALFSPVINPALLIRATAAGIDLGSILNDLNLPLPLYRFAVMAQKATELTSEVKALGGLLLSVLEKRDAEALSVLRAGQETKLLTAVALLKKKQIDDAKANIDLLNKQKEAALMRQSYYLELISGGTSIAEKAAIGLTTSSMLIDGAIVGLYFAASAAYAEPNFFAGALVNPTTGGGIGLTQYGGSPVGDSLTSFARNLGSIAQAADKSAALTNVLANYQRRTREWQFQRDVAKKDVEQIDKQIANAQLRLEIAQIDADNQQLQIDQANETADFLNSKYTNQDLYNFMITQVSNTYFKSYQLAYKVAKQAEQCFRYELGMDSSAYINFGYWDSLRKGLTSGEQLFYDIKAMEVAYLEQNKREQELTKSISLSQLDPVALHKLKTNGDCWINLPEELFDMDYPGHYMRRIKSVSLTIPCIAGPYTTVSAKLTMTNNSMRVSPLAPGDPAQYPRKMTSGSSPVPTDDPRFRDSVGALQSISTSSAQNDSGLFELNFRDERYLPFEGAGAISLWHLELPSFQTVKQFEFDSISDVIVHLKYTARDGGDVLKTSAATSLKTKINQMLVSTKDTGLMRIFSAKNDLPTEWYRFLNPVNPTDDQVLALNLDKTRFPLFVQDKAVKIKSIELIADSLNPINGLVITPAPIAPAIVNLTKTNIYGNNLSVTLTYNNDPGTWTIKYPGTTRLTADAIKNLVIIVHYEVTL